MASQERRDSIPSPLDGRPVEYSESLFMDYACAKTFFYLKGRRDELPLPQIDFPVHRGREFEILQNFYRFEEIASTKIERNEPPKDYVRQKTIYFRDLATEIRRKHRYYLFPKIMDVLAENSDMSTTPYNLLTQDTTFLYLLTCGPNRLLVGTKDGVFWKNIRWPEVIKEIEGVPAHQTALTYLSLLKYIGRRELAVVPENPAHPHNLENIKIPKPARSLESLLENTYYHQRYIVPPEGAEVRFKKAGDLEKMFVIQTGHDVFAKAITTKGEALVWIDVDNASWFSPDTVTQSVQSSQESPWANILGEVYHDLVTAVELPHTRYKTLGRKRSREGGEDLGLKRPQIIYIPRVIRVGEKPKVRLPYEGPLRPITPHKVQGHRRRANLSERHRLTLMKFEAEYGISILKNLPAGFTFVRPYVVPQEADIQELPTFIKRRIETRLAQELQKPVD